MIEDFKDTVYLFACAAHGTTPKVYNELDIERIFRLSDTQRIWPIVFCALKKLREAGKLEIDDRLYDRLQKTFVTAVGINATRLNAIRKTLKCFERENVRYVILKGETLANLYHEPLCRISNDTDVFVVKEDWDRAIKILASTGYEIQREKKHYHHTSCFHPIAGHLELHHDFFGETTNAVFFDNFREEEAFTTTTLKDGAIISTLGITDACIYNCLHMIKHYLGSGSVIKSCMDCLLYMKYFKDEIDWPRVNETFKQIKFNQLMDQIVKFGVRYLGFTKDDFGIEDTGTNLSEEMLIDLYSSRDEKLLGFKKLVTKERVNQNNSVSYKKFMKKHYSQPLLSTLFPNSDELREHYSYLAKCPYLLPVAWIHRFGTFFVRCLLGKRKPNQVLKNYEFYGESNDEAVQKRLELLRKLKVI